MEAVALAQCLATSMTRPQREEETRRVEMIAPDKQDIRAEKVARQRFGQKEEVLRQHLHKPEEDRQRRTGRGRPAS